MSDKINELTIAPAATYDAKTPFFPMRGPKNTMSVNDANGKSQAMHNSFGSNSSKFMRALGRWVFRLSLQLVGAIDVDG